MTLGIETVFFPCNNNGQIDPVILESELKRGLCLISCILVQNETGIIQPLEKIIEIRNKHFEQTGEYVPVFSDTIQAISKIDFPLNILDGFTIAGHKIGCGIGSSTYYLNPKLKQESIFKGGNQENSRRAGTENLFGIFSLAAVLKHLDTKESEKNRKNIPKLRKYFEEKISKLKICKEIVGKSSPRNNNTSFIILKDVQIDFLLMYLDSQQIYISTGSSCKSGARTPSDVLLAMCYNEEDASNRIRISIGSMTTKKEIDTFIFHLEEFIKK